MCKKVLYVDDEVKSEKFLSRFELFSDAGINVMPIDNVDEVLLTITERKNKIAVIVLDLIMPLGKNYSLEETEGGKSTGIQILKEIRLIDDQVPVVIVSARNLNNMTNIFDQYKVNEYFEKPISSVELINIIKKYL